MFCKYCNAPLEEGDLFCPSCGMAVENGTSSDNNIDIIIDPPAMKCPKCGSEYEPGDLFCMKCGFKLSTGGSEPPVPDSPSSAPHPSGQAAPEPPVRPSTPTPVKSKSFGAEPSKGGDDPNERHVLIILSRDEMLLGCQKTVEIEGRAFTIDVPSNYDTSQSMYFSGLGYKDGATGKRGALKVDFIVD